MMKLSTAIFEQLVGLKGLLIPNFKFKNFLWRTDEMSYGEKDGIFTICSIIMRFLKSSTPFMGRQTRHQKKKKKTVESKKKTLLSGVFENDVFSIQSILLSIVWRSLSCCTSHIFEEKFCYNEHN